MLQIKCNGPHQTRTHKIHLLHWQHNPELLKHNTYFNDLNIISKFTSATCPLWDLFFFWKRERERERRSHRYNYDEKCQQYKKTLYHILLYGWFFCIRNLMGDFHFLIFIFTLSSYSFSIVQIKFSTPKNLSNTSN